MTTYQQAIVDGARIFYREAGPKDRPTILLLHGFPTSSHMFRNLIPALADRYHLVAPDLPGFGFSDAPDRKEFGYTFEKLAKVIGRFTEIIGIDRYAIYVFDYGAPVGLRLALAHPERIAAIISQSGNAYEEGLSQGWNPIQKYWKEPTAENRAVLREFLTPEATKSQYTASQTPLWLLPKHTNWTPLCCAGRAMTRFSWTSFWTMPATSRSIPNSRNTFAVNSRQRSRSGGRAIRSSCLLVRKRSNATTPAPRCVSLKPATSPWKRTLKKLQPRFAISSDASSTA
jgi:pimeloyl-ACP methyl ester carboxylesterase